MFMAARLNSVFTEEIIGEWFAQGGGRRDAVVLATKVYNPVSRAEYLPEPNRDHPQPCQPTRITETLRRQLAAHAAPSMD